MTAASKRPDLSGNAPKTPFNKQPIGKQKRQGKHPKREETISERETGFTPEQLREQQLEMRRRALARFMPGYTPPEADDLAEAAKTEERRSSRPRHQPAGGSAPKPSRKLHTPAQAAGRKSEGSVPETTGRAHKDPRRRPSDTPSGLRCQHCGAELSGTRTKWCSDRCRKLHTQGSSCDICGKETYGKRCAKCGGHVPLAQLAPRRQAKDERQAKILEMRREGMFNWQIAVALDIPVGRVYADLTQMRKAGVDVGPPPYHGGRKASNG